MSAAISGLRDDQSRISLRSSGLQPLQLRASWPATIWPKQPHS